MRAVVYLRVSDNKQESDGVGLDVQAEACRAFSAEQGWEIVGEFRDVFSGFYYRERPNLTRMRTMLRERLAHVVVCYDVSRLSRNQAHLAILMEEAQQLGVRYQFTTEQFEDTAVGQFVLMAKGFAAQVEREKIVARTQGGIDLCVKLGRPITGKLPYGYQWREVTDERGKVRRVGLTIHDERAAVVREIYRDLLAGKSARQVCIALNDRGLRTGSGCVWRNSNLAVMLRNPVYKGEYTAFRLSGKAKKGKEDAPARAPVVYPDFAPALVTPDEWDAALMRLESGRTRSTRNLKNPEAFMLRGGFVRCGYCGRALHCQNVYPVRASGRTAVTPCYACTNSSSQNREQRCPWFSISAPKLEQAVLAYLRERLAESDKVKTAIEAHRQHDPTEADRERIDRLCADAERRKGNLLKTLALLDDDATRATLAGELTQVTKQIGQLTEERAQVERRHAAWQRSDNQLTTALRMAETFRTRITPALCDEDKRTIITALGVEVRVWATTHTPRATIRWSLPLDDDGREHALSFITTTGYGGIHKLAFDDEVLLAA